MKFILGALLAFTCFFAAACDSSDDDFKLETRPLAVRDAAPKLHATSDQRFRDAKPSPVTATTPDGWLELPASQFRLLNYRFGESGLGEVWVSLSSGSLLENVNRWLGQFELDPLTAEQLAKLPTMTVAEHNASWVEASGNYASGMGQEPKPVYSLAGVVVPLPEQILTVKMVGPSAEVEKAVPALRNYLSTVRVIP